MTSPAYGVIFNRDSTDPSLAQPANLSVIRLVLLSEDADATVFPLNEPVAFDPGDVTYLGKLDSVDLQKAILAIDDQLTDFQTSARIVAVKIAKGANDAATIVNIIGERTATNPAGNVGTGIYALLRACSCRKLHPS